jgi:flagellar assembly factor FliW
MILTSSRLGRIEVPDTKVISMARPILGFERLTEFCLVEVEAIAPFLWLHSVEDPTVAFLVVNPLVFFPKYRIEINSAEIAELEVDRSEMIETYVIATVPTEYQKMSVNLQGPILINPANNLAKQLVLVNSDYKVRHFLMPATDSADVREVEEETVGV